MDAPSPASVLTTTPATVEPAAAPAVAAARRTIVLALAAAAGALYVFFTVSRGGVALSFPSNALLNVGQTIAPLVAIAAFIERAVEVVISPWRDTGGARLQGAALTSYKLQTQSFAYAISLALSLLASMVGVRGVAALVDGPSLGTLSAGQHLAFTVFDVIVTSLLLSGGSDGIHQVITTITAFLDSSKNKMTK
jgi:hypothetical protein